LDVVALGYVLYFCSFLKCRRHSVMSSCLGCALLYSYYLIIYHLLLYELCFLSFNVLTLLVGQQKERLASK